jgi:hypothetical protein
MSRKSGKGQFPSAANEFPFLTRPLLLRSESEGEFDQLVRALKAEIQPYGVIEDMYVAEIAIIIWEILRFRRCKMTILNAALRQALINFIDKSSWRQVPREDRETDYTGLQLGVELPMSEAECERWRKVGDLAKRWFSSKSARQEVSSILRRSQQDESAIEVEAIRKSSTDLDWLEKMLTALEARRDRSLRRIAEYRESFADRVRASADRIIDAEPSRHPRLEDGTKQSAA